MPPTKRRLASEVQRYLSEPAPPSSSLVTGPYPSRPKRRARRDNRTLLGDVERALRRLQEATSRITVVGMREADPVTYEIGDDAYAAAEALRQRISRALS
jgi:hypothetical protein